MTVRPLTGGEPQREADVEGGEAASAGSSQAVGGSHEFTLLFHVHTRASYDSLMSPRTILRFCRRRRIDAVVICDHDSGASLAAAARLGRALGVTVIPAIEYATRAGDLIGLFVERELGRSPAGARPEAAAVLDHIQGQGGLSLLPHPYVACDLVHMPLDRIDVIEAHNARRSRAENAQSAELAQRLRKPALAGCDAHLARELGLALNRLVIPRRPSPAPPDTVALKHMILEAPRSFVTRAKDAQAIHLSRAIKGIKLGRPSLAVRSLMSAASHGVRQRLWRLHTAER